MHVLILPSWYPAHPGDIRGVFFREQALALAKHGLQVGVIHPQLCPLRAWKTIFTSKYGIKHEIDAGLPTLRSYNMAWFPVIPHANAWLWLRHGLRLYDRYVEQYGQPELIHVHSMLNAGVLAQALARRDGIPFVVTEHSTAYARGILTSEQLCTAVTVAGRATRCFAVSRTFCNLLQDILGSESGCWEEMPNIVDHRFLDRPLSTTHVSEGQWRFVTVALLTERKGLDNLVQAFAKAFPDDPTVTLDICGDGPDRSRLEVLAVDLGVAGRVRFLGALNRDQVVEATASADALVLASRYETFGVVVIEALALGKPVIATRCGGPESIVREQDGILVPTDDVDALADAMRQLREGSRQYQAAAIRAGCQERYSEQAVVERLRRVYEEALQEPTRV